MKHTVKVGTQLKQISNKGPVVFNILIWKCFTFMFNFPAVSGCFGVNKHWIAAVSGPLMMKPAQNDCKISD